METVRVLSVPQLLERAAVENPSKEAIYDCGVESPMVICTRKSASWHQL